MVENMQNELTVEFKDGKAILKRVAVDVLDAEEYQRHLHAMEMRKNASERDRELFLKDLNKIKSIEKEMQKQRDKEVAEAKKERKAVSSSPPKN